jgi:hypothetical protein
MQEEDTPNTFAQFPPAMQQAFISLMQAQARSDERLDRFDERLDRLAAQTNAALDRTNAAIDRLTERVNQTTATVDRVSRDIEKLHQDIDKVHKAQGRAENNRGAEVEEFFYNTLMHEPVIGHMQFDKVLSNHMIGKKGKETELDLVLINGNSLAVVEVKSKFHPSDLDQLQKHIDFLRDHSPEFKNYQFYGGIAGFSIPKDVTHAAHEQGYFVLKRRGKVISINTNGMTAQ